MPKLIDDSEIQDNQEEIVVQEDKPLEPFLAKYHDEKGIAKALIEKDNFIKRLQEENAQARVELQSRENVESVVDRLLNRQKETPKSNDSATNNESATQGDKQASISLADVEKLLEQRSSTARAETNLEYSKRELSNKFGADWPRIVAAKAKEIGESIEYFDELAKTRPNTLFSLLGSPPAKKEEPKGLNGINSTAQTLSLGNTSGQRTQKWYNDLKAKQPEVYRSPKMQNQMHKDALELREAFFDV